MKFEILMLLVILMVGIISCVGINRFEGKAKNITLLFSVLSPTASLIYLTSIIIVQFDESKHMAETLRQVALYAIVFIGTPTMVLMFLFIIFKLCRNKQRTLDWFTGKI